MARLIHKWAELERGIHGELILPDAKGYDRIRKPFIARFDDIRPQAVVRCAGVNDVVAVLRFAARQGINLAIRSGGHSLAGLSSTTGILIDVSPMNSVTVGEGTAIVGAGTRLGELYERLLAHDVTVPAGTCPSVGIAGLTLAGGFGLLGRMYGLTLDHLLQMTVVLGDGRIVECDEENERDLFWAMRGAGAGNLGVATALVFRTVPAPPRVTNFDLVWPFVHGVPVFQAWQGWAPAAPDELCAELQLSASADPEGLPFVHVQGAAVASNRETRQWLDELVSHVGIDPSSELCREGSYREAVDFHGAGSTSAAIMEDTPSGPPIRQGYRSTKSEFFDQRIPNAGNVSLLENLSQHRSRGEVRSLYIVPWGGAYNRRPANATAFAHRSQLFLIEHSAFIDPTASASEKAAADDWVRCSWESVHPYGSGGVYPGFPDLGLSDWASAYHADNLPRLLRVKATYDPDGVFNTQQALVST